MGMKFAFDYQFSIEHESIDSFLFLPSKAYILRSLYSHQRFVLLQIISSLDFLSFAALLLMHCVLFVFRCTILIDKNNGEFFSQYFHRFLFRNSSLPFIASVKVSSLTAIQYILLPEHEK